MTYLEIINKVLVRMREPEASSVAESEYVKLIGQFVNDCKREVENAWEWLGLRSTIQITTTSGDETYSLTGAGDRYTIKSARNVTRDHYLTKAPYNWMRKNLDSISVQNGPPYYYDIQGEDSSGDPIIVLWPKPDAAYTLNFYCVVRQGDLTSGSTEVTVPWEPIYLGAYAMAIEERGDEDGTQLNRAQDAYSKSMADHIALDMQKTEYEDTWRVK